MAASLRSFRADDAGAVVELSRRALARPEEQVANPTWTTREELASELADWDPPAEETLLVDEQDGALAGFGGIEVLSGWEHAELFGPLVAPRYRGEKVGGTLLDASVELARKHRVPRLRAAVGTRNARGRRLLEDEGFRPIEIAEAVFRLIPSSHRPVGDGPADVDVRRGRPDDLDAVLSLYRACFPHGRFPDSFWRDGLAAGDVYVAEAAGRVVGMLDVDVSDRWIYHVGVAEDERGRGVAGLLLSRALEDYWRRHPDDTLGLAVAADNVPAIRLYRRQGFAPWLVLQGFELVL